MSRGQSAEAFDAQLTPGGSTDGEFDPFAWLDEETEEISKAVEPEETTVAWASLFSSDFSYAQAALEAINQELPLQLNVQPDNEWIELTMPKVLRSRFARLPKEIMPAKGKPLILSASKEAITKALEESRRSEESWPAVQYLWPLHPVVKWLSDRNMTAFKRHQAPVISLPSGLGSHEIVFITSGVIPKSTWTAANQPLAERGV